MITRQLKKYIKQLKQGILINERGEIIMRKIEINIYKFKELEEKIQEKIVCNYIDTLIEITDFTELNKNSNMYKAYKKAQEMQTPWFLGQYIWRYCENKILKDLNKIEFYKNGERYYE